MFENISLSTIASNWFLFRNTHTICNSAEFLCRLNKIGKNPNLVAHREEDLGSESKTINAVVNALAAEADHVNMSDESVARLHTSDRSLNELGRTLQKLTLPRPKSENNFASQDIPLTRANGHSGRPSFHKSDTFHKESAFQWRHSTH